MAPLLPSPTAQPIYMIWQRQSRLADFCDQLRIDAAGRVTYGACQGSLRETRLQPDEQATFLAWAATHAPFDHVDQTEPGAAANLTLRVWFGGSGTLSAASTRRADIMAWAERTYDRLAREDLTAQLVAQARAHLAGRLGTVPGAITVASVTAITWADRCLGIPSPLGGCEPMPTPGLRILLALGGTSYEYRTDLWGQVLPFDLDLVTPSPLPTATPTAVSVPTAVAMPTATPMTREHTPTPSGTPQPTRTPTPLVAGGWLGEYYANRFLTEPPAFRRDDEQISFNWGSEAPAPGLPADDFSVRWTRTLEFRQGYYRFDVQADDGVRLWVAGNLVIDAWRDGNARHAVEVYVPSGSHEVILHYYERAGLAEVGLTWALTVPGPPRTATPTPEPVITHWRGAYYNNPSFLGDPVLVRNDTAIDFGWGTGNPDARVPADRFSVRWTRQVWFAEGPYRFFARVDDGVRVRVDDAWVINDWRSASVRNLEGWVWLSEGTHSLRVDYYEDTVDAEIRVGWERIERFDQWRGEYYSNRYLVGTPTLMRDDAVLDWNWGSGSPAPNLPADNFSARWTRTVALSAGRYRFSALADDGLRVYVNGVLIINAWHDADARIYTHEVALDAGWHTLIVEYYEHTGDARLSLGWELY
jgi:hypothetical protein